VPALGCRRSSAELALDELELDELEPPLELDALGDE
jgi:hypothetical protein